MVSMDSESDLSALLFIISTRPPAFDLTNTVRSSSPGRYPPLNASHPSQKKERRRGSHSSFSSSSSSQQFQRLKKRNKKRSDRQKLDKLLDIFNKWRWSFKKLLDIFYKYRNEPRCRH